MSEHKIPPPPTEQEDHITRCPWCGKVNPEIRRVPAVAGGARMTVVSIIFSCAHCKKIISIQQLPPIPTEEQSENASPNAEFHAESAPAAKTSGGVE